MRPRRAWADMRGPEKSWRTLCLYLVLRECGEDATHCLAQDILLLLEY